MTLLVFYMVSSLSAKLIYSLTVNFLVNVIIILVISFKLEDLSHLWNGCEERNWCCTHYRTVQVCYHLILSLQWVQYTLLLYCCLSLSWESL